MSYRLRAPLLLLALCACAQADSPAGDQPAELGADFFTDHVQPVLEERCFECHGPDAKRAKGGLRMDGREALVLGGGSGPAFNTQDPGASLLLTAIRYEDPDYEMPPKAPLPEEERAILERWIAAGIPWPAPAPTATDVEDARFFEQEVRPLLAERCFECHGPDHIEPKSSLRMTGRESLIAGGLSGSAITPGDPEASLLIHAVRYTDSTIKMPPRDRLSASEIAILEEWVERGAPWPGGFSESSHSGGIDIAAGRTWWAFEPLSRPLVPHASGVGPVDALLLAPLSAAGVIPNPQATESALVRRVYQDLTGLPPSPEAVAQYLSDDSPDKWDDLVDELLESKRYGVRYARHWLDVVRYAQTNGYERDREKPYAWKYRDWVVHALNLDMPYDQFLHEQLAGDELAQASRGSLAATGFLRLGPWDSEPDDRDQADFDQYDDMLRAISEGLMGVTIGCARCHDHKFDPFRQEDYYGLMAFVRNILPYRKPTFSAESRSFAIHDFNEEVQRSWDRGKAARHRELIDERSAFLERERRRRILELVLLQPAELQDAFWTRAIDRTSDQIALLSQHTHLAPTLEEVESSLEGDKRLRYALLKQDSQRLEGSFEGALDWILCAREAGTELQPTHLLARGRVHSPRDIVPPTFPPALCADDAASQSPTPTPRTESNSTGLRTVLADWITDPAHPTTARVIANRVWLWHFGEGIVPTPNDFGVMGLPPSNQDLLDWLAAELIESGWSLKHLHRVILSSEAYRRSSHESAANADSDPSNRLFWRQNLRRLDAESARDAMLATSGSLNLKMGGRGFFPELSKGALGGASRPGEGWGHSSEEERCRRALYAYSKRNMPIPFLEVLDQANSEQSTGSRTSTTVPTQTLTLTNSSFVNRQAERLAERLQRDAGANDGAQIERLFELCLQRAPTTEEVHYCITFLGDQRAAFDVDLWKIPFQSRVPDRLQTTYLESLEASGALFGPRDWEYLKGSWANEYNDTLETQRLRGPIALHPTATLHSGVVSCGLTLTAEGDRATILVFASPTDSDYRGVSAIIDSGTGTASLVHHQDPSLPSKVLATAPITITLGEEFSVHLTAIRNGDLVLSIDAQPVLGPIKAPQARGSRFGIGGWGEGVVFNDTQLILFRHPRDGGEQIVDIQPPQPDPSTDALTSLCLVLLNTNEFLYIE